MTDIRKVGTENIATIRNLAIRAWQVAYKDILTPGQMDYMLEQIYSPASLQNQVTNLGHQFVILYNENIPAGFASYSKKAGASPTMQRLHKIYLDPAQQGKGLGYALINFVIAAAKASRATDLELNVNRHNPAQAFYRKLGFTVIREEDIDIGNGYFMNDFVMNLKLQ